MIQEIHGDSHLHHVHKKVSSEINSSILIQEKKISQIKIPHTFQNDKQGFSNSFIGFWMLLDGIGLAIITSSTILEGYELWYDFFHFHWDQNMFSLFLWMTGKTSQVIGLFFLIGHASSFQLYHEIEQFGMLMLTVGPSINLVSCLIFRTKLDPNLLFNKQWGSSEFLELFGIIILDISMIEMADISVLLIELVGFMILCFAAGLQFEYLPNLYLPDKISLKFDLIHLSECLGLIMLTFVSFGQYYMKRIKVEHFQQSTNNNTFHPISDHTQFSDRPNSNSSKSSFPKITKNLHAV